MTVIHYLCLIRLLVELLRDTFTRQSYRLHSHLILHVTTADLSYRCLLTSDELKPSKGLTPTVECADTQVSFTLRARRRSVNPPAFD